MMISFTLTSTLAVALSSLAQANFTTAKAPSGLLWEGELEPGNGNVTISGYSLEDIEAQVKAISPTYSIFGRSSSTSVHERRSEPSQTAIKLITCESSKRTAVLQIDDGISYLREIKGDCLLPPGPDYCSRVSCSWNAAIFYCNNLGEPISQPCSSLGDMAQEIVDNCITYGWPDRNFKPDWKVSGKADGWSGSAVKVEFDRC